MNIIFIGGLFPTERESEFIKMSKGTIQFAANTFQQSIIKGLDFYFENVTIYTAPLLGNYPLTYKKVYSPKSKFSHNGKTIDFCIGSIRIPVFGLISKSINIYYSLIKNNKCVNPYILVYSIHTPYLLAAVLFKNKYPKSRICLIVPDLPQYMSSSNGIVYNLLKKIDIKIINYLVNSVDSFVFITDLMASQIQINERPWVRLEGIFDSKQIIDTESINMYEKNILYTGTLDSRYGILDLLEAFKLIPNSSYNLWICGDGNMRNSIIEYSLVDNRVKYFGQILHEEILVLQKKATVLVNPRTSKGEYTKYSFPIKTMEYLASGKPCIMHNLPGIPNEYLEYLFIPNYETPSSLCEKIIEVCNMDIGLLNEKTNKSKTFIFKNKNPVTQVSKIYNLIKDNV